MQVTATAFVGASFRVFPPSDCDRKPVCISLVATDLANLDLSCAHAPQHMHHVGFIVSFGCRPPAPPRFVSWSPVRFLFASAPIPSIHSFQGPARRYEALEAGHCSRGHQEHPPEFLPLLSLVQLETLDALETRPGNQDNLLGLWSWSTDKPVDVFEVVCGSAQMT